MQILLVAATEFEIAPLFKTMPFVDFLVTGVGVPMTVYHLMKQLKQKKYDLVIQAGIAGSFINSLELGKVVFVSQDTFGDLGIYEQHCFSTLFEKGFADENKYPFENGWLLNQNQLMNIFPIKKVNGITINMVTDDLVMSDQLSKKFNAQVETMEGAAFHYTCLMEKIPFLQLRGISNYVGQRDKARWKLKEAVDNVNAQLLIILNHLQSAGIENTL